MDHLKTPRGYAEDFDPVWYMDNYIKTLNQQVKNGGVLPFALDFMHDTFETGNYKGDKLLDIGTGPTVYSVISASRHVTEIQLSDISPANLDILQKWRSGEPNSIEVFEYICQKENEGMALEDRMNLVREKVTEIYDVDMRLPEPLPGSGDKYDILIASLLLCSVAKTKPEFTEVLQKVLSMIKPGGYLIVIGVLNTNSYQVGEFRFSAPDIERGDMKGMFLKENLKILDWRETEPEQYNREYGKPGISVEEGVFGMIAQKV